MATTPLQGFPIPGGADAPTNAGSFAALAGAMEKQVIQRYATAAARTTAIPAANTKAGMVSFNVGTGRLEQVVADGGAWSTLSLLGAVTVDTTAPIVGIYDATKPFRIWALNRTVATDVNGDGFIITNPDIGSGCVLACIVGGASTFSITAPVRNTSGNVTGRFYQATVLQQSTSIAITGFAIGQ